MNEPTHPPTLYVCRTKDWLWHWCLNCPAYPVSVVEVNGLLASNTKPAGDLCPECITLTRGGNCR